MVRLYRSADIALNPSRADNTPNSILEALACGVPVVTTNVGGVPYLVQHEQTALLVESRCAGSRWRRRYSLLLRDADLRRELVSNGLALAASCSWPVVKCQWLDLYARLVGERSATDGPVTQVN